MAFSFLQIHEFVDGALSDKSIFDAIATIVSRGKHKVRETLAAILFWLTHVTVQVAMTAEDPHL